MRNELHCVACSYFSVFSLMFLNLVWFKPDLVFMKQAEKLYASEKHLCLSPPGHSIKFLHSWNHSTHNHFPNAKEGWNSVWDWGYRRKTPEFSSSSWGLLNFYQHSANPSSSHISSQSPSTSHSFSPYFSFDFVRYPCIQATQSLGEIFLEQE